VFNRPVCGMPSAAELSTRLCSCIQQAFQARCLARCLVNRPKRVLIVPTRLECMQAEHYQQALAISPLHPDAWFALGYCRMKTDSPDAALQVVAAWVHNGVTRGCAS